MAMAARRERGLFDPDAAPGASPFDHTIFAFACDGDLEEGISSEASSIAGHQQLGNLVLLYDDNKISIEDNTNVAFSEDVGARYEAYGWHVQTLDWTNDGTRYHEDVPALYAAFGKAIAETGRPSLIRLRTIIGWPAPTLQNTYKAHGNALGADEVAATKRVLGRRPRADLRGSRRRHRAHARSDRARQGEARRLADRVRRVGSSARRAAGAVRPDADADAPRRLDRRPPELRRRPEGHRDPRRVG